MKCGLVLSGGGARGAYQIGVIKALHELGFTYDIVTGTSVGALNTLLLVANKFDLLEEIWKNVDFNTVIDYKYKYKNKAFETLIKAPLEKGFSIEPLEELIEEHTKDLKIKGSKIKGGLVYTEQGNKMKEIKFDDVKEEEIIDYVMASCSAFPFLKKRTINDKECYDGYYTDNMPINLAIDMGAKKIIAINVMNLFKRKIKDKSVKILELKRKGGMHFFLNFDNKKINESINDGYNDTMKQKDKILQFLKED